MALPTAAEAGESGRATMRAAPVAAAAPAASRLRRATVRFMLCLTFIGGSESAAPSPAVRPGKRFPTIGLNR
ncbi:hypothetical protein Ppa05_25840 [Planomonospora parontospora subsp. antibiotica]|nr:hypothetical protein Ppa05_25840 [Planomonospora parontospora subsp. antibiotica]